MNAIRSLYMFLIVLLVAAMGSAGHAAEQAKAAAIHHRRFTFPPRIATAMLG